MENNCAPSCPVNTHVHEVQGSVQLAELKCDPHNHRFATMSGEAESLGPNNHTHMVTFRTDTYEGHYHEFCGRTTGAFPICGGHVHYLESVTTKRDGHQHCFKVITHIEDPIEK